MNAAPLAEYLTRRQIAFALVGGFAVVARGHVRFTEDYDFLTVDPAVLRRQFWDDLPKDVIVARFRFIAPWRLCHSEPRRRRRIPREVTLLAPSVGDPSRSTALGMTHPKDAQKLWATLRDA